LNSYITPNSQFYVRNHFPMPSISARAWRLRVEGAVENPFTLSYPEIEVLPVVTTPATLECAGNGRSMLEPKEKGVQWEWGAVGNADWTGVPLSMLLDRARVQSSAKEVVLEGYDSGDLEKDPKSPGPISYARSLPVAKAQAVILAYKMNGQLLPKEHGFPVRAIVKGWYGMASVKWLKRILLIDRPFDGFYQTLEYTRWDWRDGLPTLVPLDEMDVKSMILSPSDGSNLAKNGTQKISGAAWTGEAQVARVEVSTNGGKSWNDARLTGKPVAGVWCFWEFDWKAPKTGSYSLLARATDSRGRKQPMERDHNHRNYSVSHTIPVKITVR
jgi:DMSO/TMAO reductase YedYZ molybdopterin-dependent catalytic subunit